MGLNNVFSAHCCDVSMLQCQTPQCAPLHDVGSSTGHILLLDPVARGGQKHVETNLRQ